eukprot:4651296-Pleurochrysis_carterae.AAC.3
MGVRLQHARQDSVQNEGMKAQEASTEVWRSSERCGRSERRLWRRFHFSKIDPKTQAGAVQNERHSHPEIVGECKVDLRMVKVAPFTNSDLSKFGMIAGRQSGGVCARSEPYLLERLQVKSKGSKCAHARLPIESLIHRVRKSLRGPRTRESIAVRKQWRSFQTVATSGEYSCTQDRQILHSLSLTN